MALLAEAVDCFSSSPLLSPATDTQQRDSVGTVADMPGFVSLVVLIPIIRDCERHDSCMVNPVVQDRPLVDLLRVRSDAAPLLWTIDHWR